MLISMISSITVMTVRNPGSASFWLPLTLKSLEATHDNDDYDGVDLYNKFDNSYDFGNPGSASFWLPLTLKSLEARARSSFSTISFFLRFTMTLLSLVMNHIVNSYSKSIIEITIFIYSYHNI